MIPGSAGQAPKIRVDRTEIQVPAHASSPIREEIVVMNEGRGRLYGSIRSDAPWVTVLDTRLDTTFIQKIALEIRPDRAPPQAATSVHILSTGGIARIKIEIPRSPLPISTLRMDEKIFQFCSVTRDETISFSLTVRNAGPGFLSGTVVPLCDWIEIPARGIWTKSVQVIPVSVIVSKAPCARHPVGRIHVRTNGGEETVEVSIHRSPTKGPVARFIPTSLRMTWSVRGIIEERLIIRNAGTGTLRGTIPSKYPWISAVPSIFSVEDSCNVTIRVDTRLLPGNVPASVPLMIITNAGPNTLNLEITRVSPSPMRPRTRLPRVRSRSRMTVLDHTKTPLQIVSSGKSGGEGEIWYIEGDDSRCVKIFHPHRCSQEMEEKLRAMQNSPLTTPPGTGICWPTGVVTSTTGPPRFMGYLMNRLGSSFSPVHAWYDLPDQDFDCCLKAAGKLARVVHLVHASGHCVGDLRENNVFISDSGEICLIDTDSFQVTDPASRKTWFCKVGTGEYLPPELICGSFEKQDIDRLFADRFALAVLIFRFLMQGAHPYQGRGPLIEDAPTTPEKILRGLFAYEGKIPGLYPPDYAPSYSRIPSVIRSLFHEAFVTGHQHPQARPGADRWAEVLRSTGIPDRPIHVSEPESVLQVPSDERVPEPGSPEFRDEEGARISIGPRLVRIHHGEIRSTDRRGLLLFLGHTGLPPLVSCPKNQKSLPPSVLIPVMMVYQEQKVGTKIQYLIPEIDLSRYVHWHIATDPMSRSAWRGTKFSFRHRVAACRNLLSALLSLYRESISPFSLSPRSVFVGPDSSVRIIGVPGDHNPEEDLSLLEDVRLLLFMMLMNGYHPDHGARNKNAGIQGHIPSSEVIPFLMREIWATEPNEESMQVEAVIRDWFFRSELSLYSMIPCHLHPDHWFGIIPGFCPFCYSNLSGSLLPAGPVPFRLSCPVLLLLSAPYQMVRHLKRRRIPVQKDRIPVIILPSSGTVLPRISGRVFCLLPSWNANSSLLPALFSRCSLMMLPTMTRALVVIPAGLPEQVTVCMLPDLPDISLIDEMRWVSSLEYMKGVLFPRLNRVRRARRPYVRKTYPVMLFPGLFYMEKPVVITRQRMTKGKKPRKSRVISQKLSEFVNDLFG